VADWIECQLCPKYCRIPAGGVGDCRIRMHLDGELLATTFGRPCAVHMDPIEKKPLFHFLPGTKIFSVATVGCNLHCSNCQNHTISQALPEEFEAYQASPEELVEVARKEAAKAIAYTYTEPLVYYEYTLATARAAREMGLRNVLVTAGYINDRPLRELLPFIDAANVDLKAFSDSFYKDRCGGTLKPVLNTLQTLVEMGVWLEITNLVIPTLNDAPEMVAKMCQWIETNLGKEVPLHFSRFHPRHQLTDLPPTPAETLEAARQQALDAGLRHVYVGNLRSQNGENTFCPNPSCPHPHIALVERIGFQVIANRLQNGTCPHCHQPVAGVWTTHAEVK
jgi:pyruvate formate lyase activating enzyme